MMFDIFFERQHVKTKVCLRVISSYTICKVITKPNKHIHCTAHTHVQSIQTNIVACLHFDLSKNIVNFQADSMSYEMLINKLLEFHRKLTSTRDLSLYLPWQYLLMHVSFPDDFVSCIN